MVKTWKEIKSECINLGFEKSTAYQKNPSIFIEAANRTISLIAATVRPIIGKYVVTQNPMPNLLKNPLYMLDIQQYAGEPLYFSADGVKSYYFECDGNGTAMLSNGVDTELITLASNREFKAYRGFMGGSVTLTFSGDYTYNIRNLAMYGMTRSDNIEDIPAYSQYVAYNIAELTKVDGNRVFMDFSDETPIQQGSFSSGNAYRTVADYKKEQRKIILLNYFDEGQFEVWYKKYPQPITAATPDDYAIELDYEVAMLVPLMMGYYIWLDDDERKAVMYRNDYDDQKNEIMGNAQRGQVAEVIVQGIGRWD